jgi:hypothetical protein
MPCGLRLSAIRWLRYPIHNHVPYSEYIVLLNVKYNKTISAARLCIGPLWDVISVTATDDARVIGEMDDISEDG